MQQQNYNILNFFTWIIKNKIEIKIIHKKLSTYLIIIFIVNYIAFKLLNIPWYNVLSHPPQYLACVSLILLFTYLEKNPSATSNNPLSNNQRFNRTYYLSLVIALTNNLFLLNSINLYNYFIILLLAIHLIPIYAVIANIVLSPVEKIFEKKTNNCTYW
jgi:Ni,Fe-hydrogenase I cytochrome b subunit